MLSDLSAGPSEKLADRWLGSLTDPIVPQSNMNIKCNQQAIADRLSPFSLSQASGVVLCSGVVQWCCGLTVFKIYFGLAATSTLSPRQGRSFCTVMQRPCDGLLYGDRQSYVGLSFVDSVSRLLDSIKSRNAAIIFAY